MMEIKTSRGSIYSYIPYDNSIVEGVCEGEQSFCVKFKPLPHVFELSNIDSYTIGVTEQCNFRCLYCCYSGKYNEHRIHSNARLSIHDIPSIIKFIQETAVGDVISVDFYGGECLLEFDWIKAFIELADKTVNKRIKYEVSTNGILLTSQIVDWLVKKKVHLFVSVDGIGQLHDRARKDVFGNGTFKRVSDHLQYIKDIYPDYWVANVDIMMTIFDIKEFPEIAVKWNESKLLYDKIPIRISEVATVYNSEIKKLNFEEQKSIYIKLLEFYIENPDNALIKAFFNIWLAEWVERPIFTLLDKVEYPTCIPQNKKLYIDAKMCVGICENISDNIRIGTVERGLDFSAINSVMAKTAEIVEKRCSVCPIARVCDVCPDVMRLSGDEQDVYCYNQKVLQRIKLLIFCELAEEGLI